MKNSDTVRRVAFQAKLDGITSFTQLGQFGIEVDDFHGKGLYVVLNIPTLFSQLLGCRIHYNLSIDYFADKGYVRTEQLGLFDLLGEGGSEIDERTVHAEIELVLLKVVELVISTQRSKNILVVFRTECPLTKRYPAWELLGDPRNPNSASIRKWLAISPESSLKVTFMSKAEFESYQYQEEFGVNASFFG